MSRYDTQLAVERGQVRSGMSPNRNDYWAAAGYDRGYRPRETHYWRRPHQLRGEVRGGAAFSYGFGDDYDEVYRRDHGGPRRNPAGYWGRWLGGEGYPGEPARRYGHDFRNWNAEGRPDLGNVPPRHAGYRPRYRYDRGY